MILKFEEWVQRNEVNSQAAYLFSESVMCYKIGAYMSAYIMAFLGFQISIKDRMIKSKGFIPDNMNERHYNNILKRINDANQWDKQIYDAITMKNPAQIFLINDDIITEYQYLKKIRNDCAHAKHNRITNSHVEILWSFIEVNYYKFILNGGKAALLDKIERHLDIRYTAPNSSWDSIVEIITGAIETSEIKSFFQEVCKIFEENFSYMNVFKEETKCNGFWKTIISSDDESLKEQFIEFLKEDKKIFISFLLAFPTHLYYFFQDTNFMRVFWNDWLWDILRRYPKIFIDLAYSLLQQQIIPVDERAQFIKKIVTKSPYVYEKSKYSLLFDYGYGDYLKSHIFNQHNYAAPNGINYANSHWMKIKEYITLIDLDFDVVELLNDMYLLTSFGDFHDGMTNLFERNSVFTEKYKKIIIENQLRLPNILDVDYSSED